MLTKAALIDQVRVMLWNITNNAMKYYNIK